MKLGRSIIIVVVVLLVAGGIYFQLHRNKQHLNNEIAIAERKIDAIPVKVDTAKWSTLDQTVISNGSLEANDQLTVVSETQGKITHVYKDLGDPVQKGDVIVKVEDETIAASVMVAEANVEQQQKDIERYKRLQEGNAITKHDLEKAEIGLKKAKADLIKAKKALSNTSITAPISGVINQKFITEGQWLNGGKPVAEIVDNHQLKIHVKIDGNDIYKIQKGETVNVSIPVFPERTFPGKVTAIAVKADQAMKFAVEISLDNPKDVDLKSGLYAEVDFPVKSKKGLVIPKESIVGSMEKPQVFVVENQRAVLKYIVTGISNDSQIEVISGLNEGNLVIYSGQLNLSGNEKVKIIK
ncbi:MAG TPA: efflux RND transporter periplasmic adaptor subunit [Sunxiuqinia sp.]|nr:efflux RND transporter periplasmic adaptor subunit [Sunxiuqinia sp.]